MQSPKDTQGLSMGEDVAGLNDDDNPAPEEVGATADETTKNVRLAACSGLIRSMLSSGPPSTLSR